MADVKTQLSQIKVVFETLEPVIKSTKGNLASLDQAFSSFKTGNFANSIKEVNAVIGTLPAALNVADTETKIRINSILHNLGALRTALTNIQSVPNANNVTNLRAAGLGPQPGPVPVNINPTAAQAKEYRTELERQKQLTQDLINYQKLFASTSVNSYEAAQKALQALMNQEAAAAQARLRGQTPLGFEDYKAQYIAQQKAAADAAKAQAELAARQRLEQQGLRSSFGSVLGGTNTAELERFNGLLDRYGINASHITGITKDLSSGVSQISFRMEDANGVIQQGSVHVDRFGRILQDTSGRFKNFGDLVARNISKVLEWAVAIGVVYGALNKVSEALRNMATSQEALVDLGITSQQSAKYVSELADSMYKVSQTTATDFNENLNALNIALRATSDITDPMQRAAVSVDFLKNALTLARLAGIDEKSALDTLLASLKQMGQPLSNAGALVGKFQIASQNANVSIEDLATTFAITSGSASDVGVDVDHLTGLISAFSEASSLGARETGNALRAMFSNFTQPAAIDTLSKYGIAVKSLTGEFRSFTEVFDEVAQKIKSGEIGDRAAAEIANALGGGSRRQAQVQQLLATQTKATQITSTVANVTNATPAEDALAKKTDTLNASVKQLNNAFENLAKTLGTEGGILNALTGLIKGFTGILDVINGVTKTLGPSTTALLAYVAAWATLSKYGPNIKEMLGGIGLGGATGQASGLLGALMNPQLKQTESIPAGWTNIRGNLWRNPTGQFAGPPQPEIDLKRDLTSTALTAGKQFAQAALPVLAIAYSQFNSGNKAEAAGAAIAGGFTAALTGSSVWATIAALIGQEIGKAAQRAIAQNPAYQAATKQQVPQAVPVDQSPAELRKLLDQYKQQFLSLSGQSSIGPGSAFAEGDIRKGVGRAVFGAGQESSPQLKQAVDNYRQLIASGKDAQQAAEELAYTQKGLGFSAEDIQKADQFLKIIDEIDQKLAHASEQKLSESLPVAATGVKSLQDLTDELDRTYNKQKQFNELQKYIAGDVSRNDYKTLVTNLQTSGGTAAQTIFALKPELINASSGEMSKYVDLWKEYKDLLSSAGTEDYSFISEITAQLINDQKTLNDLKAKGATLTVDEAAKLAALPALIAQSKEELEAVYASLKRIAGASDFKYLGFQDVTQLNSGQINKALEDAKQFQSYYEKALNIPTGTLAQTAEPFVIAHKQGVEKVEGLYSDMFSFVIQKGKEASKQVQDSFNFQDLRNIGIQNANKIQAGINYYTQLLKKYGFNEKNETITVLFKDNQVGQLVGSQTALRLALEDNTEVTKKQTEGVYNIPSGATAFVPVTAASVYRTGGKSGQGQFPNYPVAPTPVAGTGGYPTTKESYVTPPDFKTLLDNIKEQKLPPTIANPHPGETTFDKLFGIPKETSNLAQAQIMVASIADKILAGLPHLTGGRGLATGGSLPTAPEIKGGERVRDTSRLTDIPKLNVTVEPAAVNLTLKPIPVKNEFTANITLQVNGRALANVVKPYLFEDYQNLTASAGSAGRQAGNIIGD